MSDGSSLILPATIPGKSIKSKFSFLVENNLISNRSLVTPVTAPVPVSLFKETMVSIHSRTLSATSFGCMRGLAACSGILEFSHLSKLISTKPVSLYSSGNFASSQCLSLSSIGILVQRRRSEGNIFNIAIRSSVLDFPLLSSPIATMRGTENLNRCSSRPCASSAMFNFSRYVRQSALQLSSKVVVIADLFYSTYCTRYLVQ